MSLQFIIDAYNIINHPTYIQHTTKKIKDSRIALLEFIKTNRLCGSPKNKITVVFDGYSDVAGLRQNLGALDVVFSKDKTADHKINKLIEESRDLKNIIVVSDDREIGFFAKAKGCGWMGVEEFINPVSLRRQKEKNCPKPELNYSQVKAINDELRKIWLR